MIGSIYLGSFHQGSVHISQRRYIKDDRLPYRSSKEDKNNTPESISFISQPVNILVNQSKCLANIIKNTIIVIEHPFPYYCNCHRTCNYRQIKDTPESR